MRRFRSVAVLGSLVVAAGLVTAGQAGADDEVLGTNGAPVPELSWGPCAEWVSPEYECAEAEVPLSYRDPHGESITLALGRLPAADQANKLGTIFYNPGGPGGSGRIPPELTPELHQRFDIVGFDPRGVAESTPLRCFDDPAQGELLAGSFPVTPGETRQRIADTRKGTDLCARNAGPLIGHLSTANVARDMDLLRQALGEEQTSYYGISYGSHLGTVYANLFPQHVRSLVIDAVLDPVEWTTGSNPAERFQPFSYRLGSFDGSQRSLETFLAECEADERCAFREPGRDLGEKYDAILGALREGPVDILPPGASEPVEVTYQQAVSSTLGALYDASGSAGLAEFLQALSAATEPGVRARSAPVAAIPEPAPRPGFQQEDGYYAGPEQGIGVFCADTDNPRNPWAWTAYGRKADRGAPGFGPQWTWLSLPCATWPASDPDRYAGPWDKQTANPVLVVGNSLGDPATPYEDAVSTAERLGDARLLTLKSFGHGARGHSACIDSALDAYFIEGRLPAEGTVCQPDRDPFDPVS